MVSNEVRERSFLQTFSDVLAQGVLLVFLLISPWFYGLTRFRDQLLAEIFLFTFFLVTVPFLRARHSFFSIRNSFDGWVFLGLGLGLFYVLFSALPYKSLLAFLRLLSCVIFYQLIRTMIRTDQVFQIFLWAILLLGVFYSSYGLLQYYGFLSHSFWYQPSSLASRYVNSGHFAAFLLFPVFMGLSLLVSSRKVILQLMAGSFLLTLGWTLLLTRSRSVWIASLVSIVFLVLLTRKSMFLSKRALLGLLLLAGMGGLLFLSRGVLEEIRQRFQQLEGMKFYSLVYRGYLWQAALLAIRERPWGWGLGVMSAVLPRYRVHADRFFIDYAHNEFLQVGIDLGIPGILFLAGFVFFYLWKGWFFLKKEGLTDSQKGIGGGFLALWVSLALVIQVDFPLRIYATGVLFAAFLGLSAYLFESREGGADAAFRRQRGRSRSGFFEKHFWILPWTLVLISNFVTARQLFAELHFEKAKLLDQSFSWDQAERAYEKATRLAPFYELYYESLGSFYQRKSDIVFDRHKRKSFSDRAIRAYQEASRLQPYQASTHYLLASLYEREGDPLRARSEFLKAAASEPTNGFFVSEYGYFALRHSLTEDAIEAFEKLKNLPFKGDAKGGDILRLCFGLTQNYDQLRRLIVHDTGGYISLAHLYVENGRWDLAQRAIEELTQKAKEMYPDYRQYFENAGRQTAEFYLSQGRLPEALALYREAASQLPYDESVKRNMERLL